MTCRHAQRARSQQGPRVRGSMQEDRQQHPAERTPNFSAAVTGNQRHSAVGPGCQRGTQARTRRRPRGSTTSVADSACMGRPHASWLHSCVTSLRRQTVSVYSHRRRRSRQLKTSRSPASKLAHQPVPCGAQTGQLWQVLTCSDAHPGTDAHECLRWAGYDRSCGTPQDPGASRSNRAPARGARGAQSQPARAAPAPTQRPRRPRTARCRAAARPGPCSPLPARRRWPPAPGAIGRCAHARLIHAARQHLAQQQTRRGGASTGAQHCMSAAEPRMPDLL